MLQAAPGRKSRSHDHRRQGHRGLHWPRFHRPRGTEGLTGATWLAPHGQLHRDQLRHTVRRRERASP